MMKKGFMKRFALAVAVVAAGLGSSCRGETRPAAEPEGGSKAAEAKPADRAAAASGERGAAEPARRAGAREAAPEARPEPERGPVIADGTELVVTLETTVSSDKSRA